MVRLPKGTMRLEVTSFVALPIHSWMKKCIHAINRKENLSLKPEEYTPHSLRVGGCTDLARNGDSAYFIEQQGRWSSKCWKTTYVNLDWRDISKLSQLFGEYQSVNDLKRSNPNPFVDDG